MKWLLLALLLIRPAAADTLDIPRALERAGPTEFVYRMARPGTGTGLLTLEWTDSLGRLVERQARPLDLTRASSVPFTLDLARAVALRNTVTAHLILDAYAGTASAGFIARPHQTPWDDYRILMWHDARPAHRALGVTAGKVFGIRGPFTPADVEQAVTPLADMNLQWFVENIATDFYAPYHRWTPDHQNDVTFLFKDAQRRHRQSDPTANLRQPSLADPDWRTAIQNRLAETVHAHAPYRPFYYSLGDETGLADLAANWDFDLSPISLDAFRTWLHLRYGTLQAVNEAWGVQNPSWSAITPPTTTEAMRRPDDNFTAWADFKIFMDQQFADAVQAGAQAVHAADPTARAALEGMQIPGWGGYDYSNLAPLLDVMEIYNFGNNIEITRALNPAATILTTQFDSGPTGHRALWTALLLGARGHIIWDENASVIAPDNTPGPRGRADAAINAELTGGLGAQLIASQPHQDPVAILYSPASSRTQWLLDHRARGDAWINRTAEDENADNAVRAAMRRTAGNLAHLGLQPLWLGSTQIALGALQQRQIRALILPQTIALGGPETTAIRQFIATGGLVLADGEPGRFNDRSRRLATPQLPESSYTKLPENPTQTDLAHALAPLKLLTGVRVSGPADIRIFDNGDTRILAIQPDGKDELTITLPRPTFIRDLHTPGPWLLTEQIRVTPDPVTPTILALSITPLPTHATTAPVANAAGETANLRFSLAAETTARTHIIHIDVINPAGVTIPHYSGNTALHGREAIWTIPFALNDPPGNWTIRTRDILGGSTTTTTFPVSK